MNKLFFKLNLCFLILLTIVVVGCQSEKPKEITTAKKLNVVATISMITDIVRNVGGDRIDVTGIIGEGIDPHLFKPSARDTKLIMDADIIFYNGLNLEVRITGAVFDKMAEKRKAVAVTDGIERSKLRKATEFLGGYDPHVWHDVTLWMKATERIRDTLVHFDPINADYYRVNAKTYLTTLESLHHDIQKLAAQIPTNRKVLVTTHDAFGYLGSAYGFEVRGLLGINTENEVGIADVKALAAFIVENGISTMFVDTSSSQQGIESVQAAVQASGFEVAIGDRLFSDAMGSTGTPEGTYVGMMQHNMTSIVNALQTELAYYQK